MPYVPCGLSVSIRPSSVCMSSAPIIEGGMVTVTFKIDIVKVLGLISVITGDLDYWTSVKSYQRTRDGRKAYCDLWDHLLGPDN